MPIDASSTMNPIPQVERGVTANYNGYITQITLPSGNKYEIVDEEGRFKLYEINTDINNVSNAVNTVSAAVNVLSSTVTALSNTIENLSKYTQFLGAINTNITASILTDGSTLTAVAIGSSDTMSTLAVTGAIVILTIDNRTLEFIYANDLWQLFGDMDIKLGALASADLASTIYTPAGTITSSNNGQFTVASTIALASNILTTANFSTTYTPEGDITLTTSSKSYINGITITEPVTANSYIDYIPEGNVTNISTSAINIQSINSITSTTSTIGDSFLQTYIAKVNTHTLVFYDIAINTSTASVLNSVASTAKFTGTPAYFTKGEIKEVTTAQFTGTAANITDTININVKAPIEIDNETSPISISSIGNIGDIASGLQFNGTTTTITVGPVISN